jgi:hypothetical protein
MTGIEVKGEYLKNDIEDREREGEWKREQKQQRG